MPGTDRKALAPGLIRFYGAVAAIFFADQLSKQLALARLASADTVPVLPGLFHFTLVYNRGIAFGFFREHKGVLLALISLSLLALVYLSFQRNRFNRWGRAALALILGGALGNWADRLQWGYVIDFLDFRVWPVFNLADSAISAGVGIFVLQLFWKPRSVPS